MQIAVHNSGNLDDLFQLEDSLLSLGGTLDSSVKDLLAVTLYDSAFASGDFDSCWEIIRLVDTGKPHPDTHKNIKLRQVHLMRLAGHVTECLKLIDYCLLKLELSADEKYDLLWEKKLLNFYMTLDYEGLVLSSHNTKAFFSEFKSRAQVFLIGVIRKSFSSPGWSWQRIIEEASEAELYNHRSVAAVCEFISILKGADNHQIRNIFRRDLDGMLTSLSLYDKLLSLAAIIRILKTKKWKLPAAALYQHYRGTSLALTNNQSSDALGLLPEVSKKNPFSTFLSQSKISSFLLKESPALRTFHKLSLRIREAAGRLAIYSLSFGLSADDKFQILKASRKKNWSNLFRTLRYIQGDIEQEFLDKSVREQGTFYDMELFLTSYNVSPFINYHSLLQKNLIPDERFAGFTFTGIMRNPFEQVYHLRDNNRGSFYLRLPIFSRKDLLKGSPADYKRCSSILADIGHFSAVRNEEKIKFLSLIEVDKNYGLSTAPGGQLLSELWKEPNLTKIQDIYSDIFHFNWRLLIENGFLNLNFMPYELMVTQNGTIYFLNVNRSAIVRNETIASLKNLLKQKQDESLSDIAFLTQIRHELKSSNPLLDQFFNMQIQFHKILGLEESRAIQENLLSYSTPDDIDFAV